jgi:hypothetical protein
MSKPTRRGGERRRHRHDRDVEDDETQCLSVSLGAVERGHRPGEPIGDELAVEHGPMTKDRESVGQSNVT